MSSKSTASHPSIPTLSRLRHWVGRHRRALAHGPRQKYSVFFHFRPHILLIFPFYLPDTLQGTHQRVRRSGSGSPDRFGVQHGCPNRTLATLMKCCTIKCLNAFFGGPSTPSIGWLPQIVFLTTPWVK